MLLLRLVAQVAAALVCPNQSVCDEFLDPRNNRASLLSDPTSCAGPTCPKCLVGPEWDEKLRLLGRDEVYRSGPTFVLEFETWLSQELISTIGRILLEEAMRYPVQAVVSDVSGSGEGLWVQECCGVPFGNFEVWRFQSKVAGWVERERANRPLKALGVGYEGMSGLFVPRKVLRTLPLADAWQAYTDVARVPQYINSLPADSSVNCSELTVDKSKGCVAGNWHCEAEEWPVSECLNGRFVPDACRRPGAMCVDVAMMDPLYDSAWFESLVQNLGLNFTMGYRGAEGMKQHVRERAAKGENVVFYGWEPDPFTAEMEATAIHFPRTTAECRAGQSAEPTASSVDCQYPVTQLMKVFSPETWDEADLRSFTSGLSLPASVMQGLLRQHHSAGGNRTVWEIACDWTRGHHGVWKSWIANTQRREVSRSPQVPAYLKVIFFSVVGVLLLLALALAHACLSGWLIRKLDVELAPPLFASSVAGVSEKVMEKLGPIVREWRAVQDDTLTALAKNLVAAPGWSVEERLALLLDQPWHRAVQIKDGSLSRRSPVELIQLRLYTSEAPDVDRDLGFDDAPMPTGKSAGHGLPKSPVGEHEPEWLSYKRRLLETASQRNVCQYSTPNRLCFRWVSTGSYQAMLDLRPWLKTVGLQLLACSETKLSARSLGEGKVLTRTLGNLPAATHKAYAKCKVGDYFAMPASTSTSSLRLGMADFMGPLPSRAVLLRLTGGPMGLPAGIDLSDLTMYPEEAEKLTPMFGFWRVTKAGWERRLDNVMSGSLLLQRIRCFVSPLRVIDAEWIGPVHEHCREAAEWLLEVADEAAVASAAVLKVLQAGDSASSATCTPVVLGDPPQFDSLSHESGQSLMGKRRSKRLQSQLSRPSTVTLGPGSPPAVVPPRRAGRPADHPTGLPRVSTVAGFGSPPAPHPLQRFTTR